MDLTSTTTIRAGLARKPEAPRTPLATGAAQAADRAQKTGDTENRCRRRCEAIERPDRNLQVARRRRPGCTRRDGRDILGRGLAGQAAANTSAPRNDDPDWPRITAVGFELPGDPSGFSLLEPLDGTWEIVEDVEASIPGHGTVTLDFALRADVNPAGFSRRGPNSPLGIPPGQAATRGSGTRFCVSGPFPDTLPDLAVPGGIIDTTIERLITGVVVGFHRSKRFGPSTDIGVWESPQRSIPLYPQ